MRFVGWVAMVVAAGCVPDGIVVGDGGADDGAGPDPSSVSDGASGDTGSTPAPPVIVGAPRAVARSGWIYVIVDAPVSALAFELGGRGLGEPIDSLHADLPGAIWRVPEDEPLGASTLTVRWIDEPGVADERTVDVLAPRLRDVAQATGLAQSHDTEGAAPECAESHTGLAFGDVDGDGAPDLFVGHVGAGARLYRNAGDRDGDGLPDFDDVTEAVGLAGIDAVATASFVDLEGDGDADLFVGRRGKNRVLVNRLVPDGELAFDDVTAALGLGVEEQRTMGVAFGDYDGDDDLDLYVVNHAWCFPTPGNEIRADDHLYRNDDGLFVERSVDLPGDLLASVGFSAAWVDVERDGDPDLVVINDDVGGTIGAPNALWRNDGPGDTGAWIFTDVSAQSGVALPGVNGMGLALGDVDDDGFVDLAFSNIGANVLLLGAGDGTFVDVSAAAGIERAELPWDRRSVTWATHLWDHDDDGDLDLYVTGGRIKGVAPMPDALFDNRGDGTFADLTWAAGLADPAHGKASALVDLDRDGAWELATSAWGDPLRVYHNEAVPPEHHFVDVQLRGRGGNRDALGAIVELHAGGRTRTCFHTQRPSLGAGGETACHFGLGPDPRIDALRIVWPDGTVDERPPPAADQRLLAVQPAH